MKDSEHSQESEGQDPQATVRPMPDVAPSGVAEVPGASGEILERLQTNSGDGPRYELKEELARGGMGVIYRVRDNDLRRDLAMKVVLGVDSEAPGNTRNLAPKTLGRFLEEAQVTGQLDHPGIVPVHHLGVDDEDRVFFTMRWVRGKNLHEIFTALHGGDPEWTVTRALWLMLKVCDAMAYAHSKQVVHRDLKPANVMAGRFGEVYVMDWGLARVIGREDIHGLHAAPSPNFSMVVSDRREEASASQHPDSHLFTVDGDVVGTPAYMAPEQARGEIDRLGARSDVYSAGAMIYHLLTGSPPYSAPEARLSQHVVLRWLLEGPPKPVHELAPDAPPELIAICEKAMAREPRERYADMSELGGDLQAYLEHRVVQAYQTGALAELRSWFRRNKALAVVSLVALLAIVVGLGAVGYVEHRGKEVAQRQQMLAELSSQEARRQEEIANRERANVLRLSAFQQLADLRREADELWPLEPSIRERLRAWLQRADALVEGLKPDSDGRTHGHYRQLELLQDRGQQASVLSPSGETQKAYTFESDDDRWWYNRLVQLIGEIEAFADPDTGLLEGVSSHGWGVRRRLREIEQIERQTLTGLAARNRWREAIASIQDREQCPLYRGLVISPQRGLLPLRRNEETGLWEFCHVSTGEVPSEDIPDYDLVSEDGGLVMVLLPGGTFRMGASLAPSDENYDRLAKSDEAPVRRVSLDPFFISKFELTQGQWARLCGARPSRFLAGTEDSGNGITDRNPLESVSWFEATKQLERVGLGLPTEAQWEYSARAGVGAPFWTGEDPQSLQGVANLNDSFAKRNGAPWIPVVDWLDDGHLCHAPVGTYAPNDFGLYEVHGNVAEWCRDSFAPYDLNPEPGTGERLFESSVRVVRGASFFQNVSLTRLGSRNSIDPSQSAWHTGVRPARRLEE